jgi:hypothetical protein
MARFWLVQAPAGFRSLHRISWRPQIGVLRIAASRNVLLLAIIQDRDDEGEAPVKTRKFQTDPLPNAGSLQGRPAGAPSHDAARVADVTRAMRRSPLGPLGNDRWAKVQWPLTLLGFFAGATFACWRMMSWRPEKASKPLDALGGDDPAVRRSVGRTPAG